MAELYVTTGDDEEHTVPLVGDRIVFGRDAACDFVLAEQRASRTHCAFEPVGKGWRVVDLQSSNGTWLGGKPVLGARLQSGDEIEIGKTILTYVGASASASPRSKRPRRRRKVRIPWEALAAPVLLAVAAYAAVGWRTEEAHAASVGEWNRYADARAALAERRSDPAERKAVLKESVRRLVGIDAAAEARRRLSTLLDEVGSATEPGASAGGAAWEATLRGIEAASTRLSATERRARLQSLLERTAGDLEAQAAVAEALQEAAAATRQTAEADRASSLAAAEAAVAEGRIGRAVSIWTAWLLRAPDVDAKTERELALRMADIREEAREQARTAAQRAAELHDAGRGEEAVALLERTTEQLRGTGYESWLETRGALLAAAAESGVTVGAGSGKEQELRERARALRTLGRAEELAARRDFVGAAKLVADALPQTRDERVRATLQLRLDDLRSEAELVAALLTAVGENPRRFTPLRLPDGVYRVFGAADDSLVVSHGSTDTNFNLALEALPAEGFAQLVERAKLPAARHVVAAVLLHDVGAVEAAEASMRIALEDEALRPEASQVWARVQGEDLPTGGYVPHPRADVGVVTQDQHDAIVNAERIAEYGKELAKLSERIAATKQAKGIEKVAEAFEALEAARKHAEELIFDEVKYFYPYKDRMEEYVPVQREVDLRVAAVREAWAHKASVKVEEDSKLGALLKQFDDIEVDMAYLGGDPSEFSAKVDRVRKYVGHELTVQTFWKTEQDLELLRSNDTVMAENAAMETKATDSEREQVRVTNLYRIMFGHRPAVRIDDKLVVAARGHSEDMARLGFFAHFSPVEGKRAPQDRIALEGYSFIGCSENIHMGSGSPQGAHDAWIGSSGHHRNLLSPAWKEMGTGRSGRHWTQNFGFRD